jgi:hypothetical protein
VVNCTDPSPSVRLPCTIVNVMSQFGASLTDDSRVVIYNCNLFIKQATGLLVKKPLSDTVMILSFVQLLLHCASTKCLSAKSLRAKAVAANNFIIIFITNFKSVFWYLSIKIVLVNLFVCHQGSKL